MTAPTCGTCRWRQDTGECRRMPPYAWSRDLKVIPDYGVVSGGPVWPKVNDYDWCGEYAPKGEHYDGPCPTCQRGYK